jgi:hypothetical protein
MRRQGAVREAIGRPAGGRVSEGHEQTGEVLLDRRPQELCQLLDVQAASATLLGLLAG